MKELLEKEGEGCSPFSSSQKDYANLSPDCIIDAVESLGLYSDGRFLALNSYENRVYQVGIEDAEPIIAKFYRPERWTDKQILEEHRFCRELIEDDIPVVEPLRFNDQSLHVYQGYRFSLFPRRAGRAGDMDNFDNLQQLGRFLGRIHAVGAASDFQYRPSIGIESFGSKSLEFVLDGVIPDSLRDAYQSVMESLLILIDRRFSESGYLQPRAEQRVQLLRCHGDCHAGNLLWREGFPNFVDFDDSRMAPAVQDLWMLLSGSRREQELQLSEVVEAYDQFREFDSNELNLIEPLRTLRIMHYAAWLARRWQDPAFPIAFPWFNTERYWGEHILELKEQLSALQEEPLRLL